MREGSFNQVRYLAALDLSEKNTLIKGDQVASIGAAPQSTVAIEAKRLLKGLNQGDWERVFYELVQAITSEEQMEPLLKIALLRQTLDTAAAGSVSVRKGFEKHLALLRESKANLFANWLDPKNTQAEASRQQAAEEGEGSSEHHRRRRRCVS